MTNDIIAFVKTLLDSGVKLDEDQRKRLEHGIYILTERARDEGYNEGNEDGYEMGLTDGEVAIADDEARAMFEAFKIGNNEEAIRIAKKIAQDVTGGVLT